MFVSMTSALLCIAMPGVAEHSRPGPIAYQHPALQGARIGSDYQPQLEAEKPEKFVPKEPLSVDEAKKAEARALFTIGYMYVRKGQLEQAYETFKEALKYDPACLAVLKQIVPVCLRLQKGDEGLEYCRQALKLDPNNYALLQFFAQHMEQQGRLDAAIDALEAACKDPKLTQEDPTAYVAIRDKLVDLHDKLGDYVGMVQSLRELVAIAENPGKYELEPMVRRQLLQQKVRLYEKLGQALKGAKQYEEAVKVLQQGMNSQPGGHRLAQVLAEVYFEMGQYPQALAELEKYISQTQSLEVFKLYEKLFAKLGKQDELLDNLKELLEKDRYNPVLTQFYAEKLIENKQYTEAEKYLSQIKDRPEASLALAQLYRETREPRKLLETLAANLQAPETIRQFRTIAQQPDLVKELAEAGRTIPIDHPDRFKADYVVAAIASESNLVDIAKEFYERCIEQRPDLGLLYRELLEILSKHERLEDIILVADRAIQRNPQELDFYDYKARALASLERHDEAVKLVTDLKSTLADRAALLSADLLLAWVYQMKEDWDRAAEICAKAIEENPDQAQIPYARYLLSNIYTLKGDLGKAEEQLLLLVEADPETVRTAIRAAANNDLGYIWADEGKNLERAQKMIETALQLSEEMRRPPNAAYLDSMGWVLFKRGEYEEAVRYLKQATETESGQDAVIWDHLGDAYLQLEKFEQARHAWEKAIELYKENKREKEREKAALVQEKIQMLDAKPDAPQRATNRP